jgi:DNA-binding transcriptional MerR regulator
VNSTISAFADQAGVSPDTLRYYERIGLLVPTERTDAGYRLYDEGAAERLRFIRGTQRTGLRLSDIKELLDVQDRGQCPCGHTELLVERRLAEVEAELAELRAVQDRLRELSRSNRECLDAAAECWPCSIASEGGEP